MKMIFFILLLVINQKNISQEISPENHKKKESTLRNFFCEMREFKKNYSKRIKELKKIEEIENEIDCLYNWQEQDALFKILISFLEDFFEKKYSSISSQYTILKNRESQQTDFSVADIATLFTEIIDDISHYYKNRLIDEIKKASNHQLNGIDRDSLIAEIDTIKNNFEGKKITNSLNYHNLFTIEKNNDILEKPIVVQSDNHSSIDYYDHLNAILDEKMSYFCGDVIDRSFYKSLVQNTTYEKASYYNSAIHFHFFFFTINYLSDDRPK
jgi:hypothetical protein